MRGITAVKAPGIAKCVVEILGIGAHRDTVNSVVCRDAKIQPQSARTNKHKHYTEQMGRF